ncbi:MAG TPA: glycosyltransferase [Flavobacterium sp.]
MDLHHIRRVLFIGLVWPEPDSSAAGTRMMQLIKLFLPHSAVTFACAAQESVYMVDLRVLGVTCQQILLNSDSFDVFLVKLNPDLVIFDRFVVEEQFGWRVARTCPNALRILDTEDLHCLRAARQEAVKRGAKFDFDALLNHDIAKREIASIFRCDLSLIISEVEMDILKSVFNIDASLLHYLPLFAKGRSSSEPLTFNQRHDFTFIGNFLHDPNVDAVRFLKTAIWSLIRTLMPDATVQIYGAYPSPGVLQLSEPKEGFHVRGRAKDAAEILEASRVLLAPIRFGAGIKGKLLEAMQAGTPSVCTSVGAEGISGDFPWNGSVCDSATDFASAAVCLYANEQDWLNAQRNGFEILSARFNADQFTFSFLKIIVQLQQDLALHRKKNFIGSLLMHHTTASTKYMSKWIEEKNRHSKNPAV